MSWNAPTGSYRQPTESEGVDSAGNETFAVIYKGPYAALKSAAAALVFGDLIDTGLYAQGWNLARRPGGQGELTITCSASSIAQPTIAAKLLKDVWKIHSVRNDMSIYAYCGDTNDAANRAELELWQQETDATLAKGFQYKSGGSTHALAGATLDVAKKIAKGVESVVRFYVVVSRQRTYDKAPADCLENIGYIDTPAIASGTATRVSSGLSAKLSEYSWLKVQDDLDENADTTWQRTESWMGLKTSDSSTGWDADLYGESRWAMPYTGEESEES